MFSAQPARISHLPPTKDPKSIYMNTVRSVSPGIGDSELSQARISLPGIPWVDGKPADYFYRHYVAEVATRARQLRTGDYNHKYIADDNPNTRGRFSYHKVPADTAFVQYVPQPTDSTKFTPEYIPAVMYRLSPLNR